MDSEGAVIGGAHLLFHPDHSFNPDPALYGKPDNRSDMTREADAMGRFNVQLESGFYDVCVMATAFTPECKKVLITNGKTIQYDTHLKVDDLVTRYLGDTF